MRYFYSKIAQRWEIRPPPPPLLIEKSWLRHCSRNYIFN